MLHGAGARFFMCLAKTLPTFASRIPKPKSKSCFVNMRRSGPRSWPATSSNLFEEVAGQDLGPERRMFTKQDLDFGFGILLANVGKVFAKHMKNRAPAPWSIGHGSSTSFRREAFQKLGGFDARFGGGAPLKACDDTEMFYRILKAGH